MLWLGISLETNTEGYQTTDSKGSDNAYSWAVHDGGIGALPITAAGWLFGSGKVGLVGIARRKTLTVKKQFTTAPSVHMGIRII